MKSLVRKIGSRYFWKIIYSYKTLYYFLFLNKNKDVIVILTPGKVGSSSVYKSLKSEFSNSYVFHIHFLNEKNIKKGIKIHKNSARKSIPNHFITSKIFNKFFINNNFNRIKFIVLFREPLDRFISDIYQNYNRVVNKLDETNNHKLMSEIEEKLVKMDHMNYLENWVNEELFENLNYNFFNFSILNKVGYYTDSTDKYDFLFFKMESLNSNFDQATIDFFGKEIELLKSNISVDKRYNSLYKETKSKVFLTDEIIDKMKSYKYSQTIYPIKKNGN